MNNRLRQYYDHPPGGESGSSAPAPAPPLHRHASPLWLTGGLLAGFMVGLGAGLTTPRAEGPLDFPPQTGTHLVLPLRAVDGDTFDFAWLVRGRGRITGIDAPELHGPDAHRGRGARDYLARTLPTGPVPARVSGRDKYGRTLLDVVLDDGSLLSDRIVEAGHATR